MKNIRPYMKLTRLAVGLMLCALTMSVAMGESVPSNNPKRAKARHFYLKGAVKEAEGKKDQAYEYYKKAYKTDSTYLDAGFSYAQGRIAIAGNTFSEGDSAEMAENISLLRKMAAAFPEDVEFAETYAFYLVQQDKKREALNVYGDIIRRRPGLSRLYLAQSYLYRTIEEIDSAVNSIREYERLEGVTSETTLKKASYHLAKADSVAALNEFKLYSALYPGDIDALMSLSMAYNILNMPDSAYLVVKDASLKNPDNLALKFQLGLMAKETGDMKEFLSSTREALLAEDLDDDTRMAMLDQYVESLPDSGSFDFKDSDLIYRELEKRYGDDATFLSTYTEYALKKKDTNLALEIMEKSLAQTPSDENKLWRVMSLAVLAGKPGKAMQAFETFPNAEARKNNSLILTYMTAAQELKEYDKALEWADSLLQVNIPVLTINDKSVNPLQLSEYVELQKRAASTAYEVAAEIYNQMGKKEDVVRCYENALSIGADNESVMNNYAYYVVETMKAKPDSPEFQKAKEMSYKTLQRPDGKEAPYYYYDTYAWILFKEKNFEEALKYQELALELAGNEITGELLDHYGDILFMNGKKDEAIEAWTKALKLDPENTVLKKKIATKNYINE